jgi:hypothetical protein
MEEVVMSNHGMDDWNAANVNALCSIGPEHVPALEQLFLAQLVEEAPKVPASGTATTSDGARIVGLLQRALVACVEIPPPLQQPELDDDVVSYRRGLLEGAHTLGAQGETGLEMFAVMLVPAAKSQIDENRGDPDGLVQGLYSWILLGLVAARDGGKTPPMWAWTGIRSSLAKWSVIFTSQ